MSCPSIRCATRFGSSSPVSAARPRRVDAVTTNLIDANLAGHDSHGIGMLPRYVDSYLEGCLQPNAHVRTVLDAARCCGWTAAPASAR